MCCAAISLPVGLPGVANEYFSLCRSPVRAQLLKKEEGVERRLVHDGSDDDALLVEPVRFRRRDVELAAVCVWTQVEHTNDSRSRVPEQEVFVGELSRRCSKCTLAVSSVPPRQVSAHNVLVLFVSRARRSCEEGRLTVSQ